MVKWQILVLTQPSRNAMREQLSEELNRQIRIAAPQKHRGGNPQVSLLVMFHDPSLTLGENRTRMLALARSEYVCFFDDDDWPAPDYVAKIFPLLDGVDYVGFRVQTYCAHFDYWPFGETFHSLKYDGWSRDGMNFYRDISHINPIRRELAVKAEFVDASKNFGEDAHWAESMRKLGIVKTQHYIDSVMYHYIWRALKEDAKDIDDPKRKALIEQIRTGKGSEHHSCPECEKVFGRPFPVYI